MATTTLEPADLGSLESFLLQQLPAETRETLRLLAVPRYVDSSLASVLVPDPTLREQVLDLPLLEKASWDVSGKTWILDQGIRNALLQSFLEEDPKALLSGRVPDALSTVNEALVDHFREAEDSPEALYHRLGCNAWRPQVFDELRQRIEDCLTLAPSKSSTASPSPDLAKAHDLLRLLDDWIQLGDSQALDLQRRLSPMLVRRSRWIREREATATYYERPFEAEIWDQLIRDDSRWILQLHAPGGAGKTMFVQNLLGRRCPAADVPCARIDFDYVAHLVTATNQAWRILLLIARQLDRQIAGNPFQSLLERYGRHEARAFHYGLERRLAASQRPQDPSQGLSDTELDQAASEVPSLFRALLAESRGEEPTVIVLDTLENLLETEGASLLGLIDTLAEIRHGKPESDPASRRQAPGLRLILSGRFDLGARRLERWGDGGSVARERVVGFRERYVGDSPETVQVGGTQIERGEEVLSLALPRFSRTEAQDFLASRLQIATEDLRDAIVDKSVDRSPSGDFQGYNPMKLTLLADAVWQDPELTAERIRRFDSSDLFYLVDRVIDRILDPGVQWLVRWGVIPRHLTRDFVERVLWPLFREQQRGDQIYDRTQAEVGNVPAPKTGAERYAEVGTEIDAGTVWGKLTHYAAAASWVSVVPELPDTLVFHPDVRDPMRGLLRKHDQEIYHELNRRTFVDLEDRRRSLTGAERVAAHRSLVFHAWEPWRDRPADPDAFVVELLDDLGDDFDLRSEIAREVLDVERRGLHEKVAEDRRPQAATLARAHSEIARGLLLSVRGDHRLLAQLRDHLDHSDLPAGRRLHIEAQILVGEGRDEAAIQALSNALEDDGLEDSERAAVLIDLGRLRRDPEPIARARELAQDPTLHRRATRNLAALAYDREELAEAARLYDEAEDRTGHVRSLMMLGKTGAADALVHETPDEVRLDLQLLIHLYEYRPMEVLDAGLPESSSDPNQEQLGIHQARALALLAQEDDALSLLDTLIHQGQDAGVVQTAIQTAARLALLLDRPKEAQDYLARVPDDLPVDRAVQLALLAIEAKALAGSPDTAWRRLDAFDRHPDRQDWLPSTRMAVALARLRFRGADVEGLGRLLEALESVDSPSRRLFLLSRLRGVGTPDFVDAEHEARIRELTPLAKDDGPRLILAAAELMRFLRLPGEARELLLPLLEPDPQQVVWRFARLALDRVGWPEGLRDQPGASEWLPERFVQAVAEEQAARREGSSELPGRKGMGPILTPATPGRRDGSPGLGFTVSGPDSKSTEDAEVGTLRGGFGVTEESRKPRRETGRGRSTLSYGQESPRGPGRFDGFLRPDETMAELMTQQLGIEKGGNPYISTLSAERLLSGWDSLCNLMGRALISSREFSALADGSRPIDLMIDLGASEESWIPWHLASIEDLPLATFPAVRGIVRGTGARVGSSPSIRRGARVGVVASRSEANFSKGPSWADQATSIWHTLSKGPVGILEGLWEEAFDGWIDVLHVIAGLEERRGSVVLRVASEWGDAVGAGQLVRRLAKRERPLLLVLDVPWTHSRHEAAHQLMLREIFAHRLAEKALGVGFELHVLAGGFAQAAPRVDWLGTLIHELQEGAPLGRLAQRLQGLDTEFEIDSESFGQRVLARGSVLYSEQPEALFQIGEPS